MDNTVKILLERIEKLEFELERANAVQEIKNCMARYCYLHTAGKHAESAEMFALQTPDVSAEIANVGLFVGPDAVRQLYAVNHKNVEGDREGFLFEHSLTCDCVEVAKDGKTAKALWITPGHETFKADGEAHANWIWGKYACDFIKEPDGVWRIWHMQMFATFRSPYEHSWTTHQNLGASIPRDSQIEILAAGATAPTTYCREYLPTRGTENWPAAPDAYTTFDETWSMVGAPPKGWDL